MNRSYAWCFVIVAALCLTATDAEAGRRHRGSHGSYGSYGSSGGVVRVSYHRHSSSSGGTSYGSYGSSGGSYGSYGNSVVHSSSPSYYSSCSTCTSSTTYETHSVSSHVVSSQPATVVPESRTFVAESKPAPPQPSVKSETPAKPVSSSKPAAQSKEAKPDDKKPQASIQKSAEQSTVQNKPAAPAKKTTDSSGVRVFHARPQDATLIVEVPTDAVLYLANQKMSGSGAVRRFRIPVKEVGRQYNYPVRIELNRDGRVLSASKTEVVTSGSEIRVAVAESELTEGDSTEVAVR